MTFVVCDPHSCCYFTLDRHSHDFHGFLEGLFAANIVAMVRVLSASHHSLQGPKPRCRGTHARKGKIPLQKA